jgi:hypothetical protein
MLQNIPSTIQAIKVGYVERYCKVPCDDFRCARMFNFIRRSVHENRMTNDFETQEETFPEIVEVKLLEARETPHQIMSFNASSSGHQTLHFKLEAILM